MSKPSEVMWISLRSSTRTRSRASAAQEMQNGSKDKQNVILISDDESDRNNSTPNLDNSQLPACIYAPPMLTDQIMLDDMRTRQNQLSCESSSSNGTRQDARYQMGRKRNEILETIHVATPSPASKRRKVNSATNAHKKASLPQAHIQSAHAMRNDSGFAPFPSNTVTPAGNFPDPFQLNSDWMGGSSIQSILDRCVAEYERQLPDLQSSQTELTNMVNVHANDIVMMQNRFDSKAPMETVQKIEMKVVEMRSALEHQVNEKVSMAEVLTIVADKASLDTVEKVQQELQGICSDLQRQINEKPSTWDVHSFVSDRLSLETVAELEKNAQERHSALELQVNGKASMDEVCSVINKALSERVLQVEKKAQGTRECLQNQVNGKASLDEVRSIFASKKSLETVEKLGKSVQAMHSALQCQVNEKVSMNEVRSIIDNRDATRREDQQKYRNTLNGYLSAISNSIHDKYAKTDVCVASLDGKVAVLTESVKNIEASVLPEALHPLRIDIDAMKGTAVLVRELDSKQNETKESVANLETKMSAVATSIEDIEKSMLPNALEPIQKDMTTLKAIAEPLSSIETEQSAIKQTIERLEKDINLLQAQTNSERIAATVHEAILTSTRPTDTESIDLPLPNRMHFEHMAHSLTNVTSFNRQMKKAFEIFVKKSEEEKAKHRTQLQEQGELIRSMQKDMQELKENTSKKDTEFSRLRAEAIQREEEIARMSEHVNQGLETLKNYAESASTSILTGVTKCTTFEALEHRVSNDYVSANDTFRRHRKLLDALDERMANLECAPRTKNGGDNAEDEVQMYIDSKLKNFRHILDSLASEETVNELRTDFASLEQELRNMQKEHEKASKEANECLDTQKSQHKKTMDDLCDALQTDIDSVKTNFNATMTSMSQSLVNRMDTKASEGLNSAIECIEQAGGALRTEIHSESTTFAAALKLDFDGKQSEWLEAAKGLISEALDPSSNEARFKFGPLFEKLFEEECKEYNQRLQTLEKNAEHSDQTVQNNGIAGMELDDYLAPVDFNDFRKYSGKIRYDVDTMRDELETLAINLRNLRRNFEESVKESRKQRALLLEHINKKGGKTIDISPERQQLITQNLDTINQLQQQYEKRVYTLEQNMQNQAGLMNRIDDAYRHGYVVQEAFVSTPPNGPTCSAALPPNANTGVAVHTPQSVPIRPECRMPPSPTSPAPFHAQYLPNTAMKSQNKRLLISRSLDGSHLQQQFHDMQYNHGSVMSGSPMTGPGAQQTQFFPPCS